MPRFVNFLKQEYLFIVIFGLFLFFMFYRLGTTIFNADEHFWFFRTTNFVEAIKNGEWEETYQNPKPGVTIMALSGLSLETFFVLYEKFFHFRPFIYTYDTFPLVSFASKAPLVLLNFFSLIFITYIVRKIFGRNISLWFLLLLAFLPYYIGVSRLFHGDGTLTVFMTLSAFVFLYYLHTKRRIWLFLSALFGGLAVLAKLQAVFLFPYVSLILFIEVVSHRKSLKQFAIDMLVWWFSAVSAVFLFFPALWVGAKEVFDKITSEAFVVTTEGRNEHIGLQEYFFLVPKILPLTNLAVFIVGIIGYIRKRNNYILYSVLYIVFYYLQMLIIEQKSARYLLPLFPFIALVGAYGIDFIQLRLSKRLSTALIAFIVAINFLWLLWNFPYYTAQAEVQPWGALNYEVGKYLNSKPNATEIKVVAYTKPHTLRPYFKGKTYSANETLPDGWTAEYLVMPLKEQPPTKYATCKFDKEIVYRLKTYWTIYACK